MRRVKFSEHPSVKFVPAAAHLHPNASTKVAATYLSKKVEKLGGGPSPVDPKTGKPLPDPSSVLLQASYNLAGSIAPDSVLRSLVDWECL